MSVESGFHEAGSLLQALRATRHAILGNFTMLGSAVLVRRPAHCTPCACASHRSQSESLKQTSDQLRLVVRDEVELLQHRLAPLQHRSAGPQHCRRLLAAPQDAPATFRQTHGQWHSSREENLCQTLERIRGGMRPNAHNCSPAVVQTGPLRRSAALTLALVAVLVFYCIIGDHRSAPRCIFRSLVVAGQACPFVPGLPFRARHARLVCRTLLSHHGLSTLLSSPRASAPGTLHRRSVGFSLPPRKADAALHSTLSRQCA